MIGFCFLLHVLSICMAIAYCQLYSWSCFPLIILVRHSVLLGTSRERETLVSPGDQASWSSALNVWHMNSGKQLEPLWSPRDGRFSCGTEVCTWILKFILILTSSTVQDRKYCGEWFLEQAFVKRMFSNYLAMVFQGAQPRAGTFLPFRLGTRTCPWNDLAKAWGHCLPPPFPPWLQVGSHNCWRLQVLLI
jgi:hypothetical protein